MSCQASASSYVKQKDGTADLQDSFLLQGWVHTTVLVPGDDAAPGSMWKQNQRTGIPYSQRDLD